MKQGAQHCGHKSCNQYIPKKKTKKQTWSENVLTFTETLTPLQAFLELGSTDGEVVKRSQIVYWLPHMLYLTSHHTFIKGPLHPALWFRQFFFFPLTFYHNHFMDMFLFYKPLYNPMETLLRNITLTVSRLVHLAANTFHFEMGKLKLQSIVKLNYLRSNFCFITGSQIIIIQVASFSFSICLGSANPPPPEKKPQKTKHCEAHESFSSTQSHTSEIPLRHSVCGGFTEYFNSLSLAVSVAFLIHAFGSKESCLLLNLFVLTLIDLPAAIAACISSYHPKKQNKLKSSILCHPRLHNCLLTCLAVCN